MNRAKLIDFCRKLPHATEDIKWGADLVFSIGRKMFAVFDVDPTGHCSFKVTPELFDALTMKPGIIPAPYAARYHWIAITDPKALPHDMARELVRESYRQVAEKLPAKARRRLGLME